MKTVWLLGVLVLARVLVVAGQTIPLSVWTPLAFLWQDLLVALLFSAVDRPARRAGVSWMLYGMMVFYVAVNVPLARILGTPLTWVMARATGGPLADSIWHYVTWQNCMLIAAVIGAALVFPIYQLTHRLQPNPCSRVLSSRLRVRWLAATVLGAVGLVILGSEANRRIDTRGLHRNPLVALFTSALPTIKAQQTQRDWARSPFGSSKGEDLTQWTGSCAGRNIILILLESTGAQYLHPYGAKEDPTPHLTELARASILFENAYCVYPESIKGLLSILCSQFPSFDSHPSDYARVRVPSLAEVLSANGYRTALFHSGRFAYLGMESVVRNRGYQVLEDAGTIGGNQQSSFGVDEPAAVERMLEWIDSLSGERFCLTYLPIAGHHPYAAPGGGPFPEADEIGRYRNSLHGGDAALGQLICGLRERNLLENTLLAFAGDHGEAFGQHEGNYGHTLLIYEENVRVPLFLAAPGLLRDPLRVRRTASLIDITPTVLDLVGIKPSPEYQGRSLLQPRDQMALFYADYALSWMGLRDGRWKFIYELGADRCKLFDLSADPGEQIDRAADFPNRIRVYRDHVREWSAAQKHRLNLLRLSSVAPDLRSGLPPMGKQSPRHIPIAQGGDPRMRRWIDRGALQHARTR